jgi:hypothetical protein
MDMRELRRPAPAPPVVRPDLDVSFDLWLEFEYWAPQPDDDPEVNFFNMQIRLSSGEKYALNVWTYRFFALAVRDQQAAELPTRRKYMLPPDLFVSRLDRRLIEDIAAELIRTQSLKAEWLVPADPQDSMEER